MDVKLPHLGEGADSGTVVNIFVKEGDHIAADQPLIELENEKAIATIPSSAAGTVDKVFVKVGEKINVGQKILSLSGAEAPRMPQPQSKPAPQRTAPESAPVAPVAEQDGPNEEPDDSGDHVPAASPAIRKLARDLGIQLSRVRGTARGGRVVLADLRAYIQRLEGLAAAAKPKEPGAISAPAREQIDFSKWGPVTKRPLSPLREVIARRMLENWSTIPHVTQFDEADLSRALALRKKHAPAYEKKGARLTVTALLLRSVAGLLKKHPIFNSSLDEVASQIVLKEYCHIGIAVDTDAGLMVPVIRDADKKSVLELARELEAIAARARDRKVGSEELKGGTFTISNQGGIGGGTFTPIINKPEVAILGLGRAAPKAVSRDGRIESRTMLPLSLSYDHRVIDGAQAARFIAELVKAIEELDEAPLALGS